MKKLSGWIRQNNRPLKLIVLVIATLAASFLLAILDTRSQAHGSNAMILPGVAGYNLLLLLGVGGLAWVQRLTAASVTATRAAWVGFLLRLLIGVALMLILPLAGYQDNQASQSGYVFKDSFHRDTQAWELAQSNEPLLTAFSGEYLGDQYGGLLGLSALIYRYLSPDAHRPYLILIVTAAMSVWGVFTTWSVVKIWFGEQAASTAAWVMALYPEAVLLGASHMREAFVIPVAAMAWYGIVGRAEHRSRSLWMVAAAASILLLIKPDSALVVFLMLIILWLADPASHISWKRVLIICGLFLLALLVLYTIWTSLPSLQSIKGWQVFAQWLENNFNFQAKITVRASGWLQNILGDLGAQWRNLVILAYGLFQPVLPAALITPGAWIWRVLGILRGAGWYCIAPLLLYSLWLLWREKVEPRKFQLRMLAIAIWVWVLIASANAGGDQWDNPRYRAMLLAFQAALAAWAWQAVRIRQDRWFMRLVAIEGVFILLFSYWYLGRKYFSELLLDIWVIVALIMFISAGIVVWGWVWDRRNGRVSPGKSNAYRNKQPPENGH